MIEKYIELDYLDKTMRGMVHIRSQCNEILIMLHGFTGTRVDNQFMFVKIARDLANKNLNVIRFDFIGSGESDGDFSSMTVSSEIRQAEVILNYVKSLNYDKIYVLGFSMGGVVASMLAKQHKDSIDKLILLSPAGNILNIGKNIFKTNKLLANKNADLNGIELSKEFLNDLERLDLYKGLESFNKPVCIIHGDKDLAVPVEYGRKYHNIYKNSELNIIKDVGHLYESILSRNQMIDIILQFIKNK